MTIKGLIRAGFSLGSRGKTGSRTLINKPYQLDDEQEQFEALLEQLGVKDLVCTGQEWYQLLSNLYAIQFRMPVGAIL